MDFSQQIPKIAERLGFRPQTPSERRRQILVLDIHLCCSEIQCETEKYNGNTKTTWSFLRVTAKRLRVHLR